MKWNPVVNALGAAAYIWAIVLLVSYIAELQHDTPDTAIGSTVMLSLFVLSVAVMAFLFFYRPVVLLLEDKKKEAISFFLFTILAFAVLTAVALFILI